MRNAFADEITALAKQDPRIILLSGDIGNRLFDGFKEHAPDRFYNCGVAEANMMSVAAGLALSGFRPVVYTITPFTTTRCFEQIRVDVAYHRAPVTIVGTGSGLSYASLGPTHHSLEDIAILRTLPEMTVFCPCDSSELRAGLRGVMQQNGPAYIRLGKKGEPAIHADIPNIMLGKSFTVREGKDVCLISTGNAMAIAKEAAETLEKQGISARVESMHTVKPLDTATLEKVFAQYKAVAVIEEHSEVGGFNGAVAEWRVKQPNIKAQFVTCALDDRFYHRVGSQSQLREHGGLTAANIAEKILAALKDQKKAA